ncbi:M48 family metallopeptidase [Anaerosporobacter faecicola]|uniref:M48 family metallopeptidase n=1 Tax=Anaerosporobacter faecicola TaxID=2718714 RepID=UPI00143CABB2|nr:SprT family zinc-dependent metalloprotease [Anaerosporobacter faecicola]
MQYKLDSYEITYQVQYGKRQKITMELSPEGLVTLKAPLKTPVLELEQFLQANKKVILRLYKNLENRVVISREKTYQEEEIFLYLGKACKLQDLLPSLPDTEEAIQNALYSFYTKQTKEITKERVAYYEKQIGVKSKSVTIVNSPKTWGTCNSNKELTFNYRLSMAAPAAIDYVVIHELCHLLHLNHDRSFWRKVGCYDPNYEKHQAYLAQFGAFMTI